MTPSRATYDLLARLEQRALHTGEAPTASALQLTAALDEIDRLRAVATSFYTIIKSD